MRKSKIVTLLTLENHFTLLLLVIEQNILTSPSSPYPPEFTDTEEFDRRMTALLGGLEEEEGEQNIPTTQVSSSGKDTEINFEREAVFTIQRSRRDRGVSSGKAGALPPLSAAQLVPGASYVTLLGGKGTTQGEHAHVQI
jgi:hypothetical protein